MLGRTDSRGRLLLLLVVFVVAAAAIVGRLAWWQIVRSGDLAAEARRAASVRTEQPSVRGSIYDRSGTVVLATTVERDRVVVAAKDLNPSERAEVLAGLGRILELDEAGRAALDERLRSARPYVIVARDILPAVSERIRGAIGDGTLPDVSLEPEPMRTYPQAGTRRASRAPT
jgi:cell division protein FtsI (penicillin-binding protein 3)